MGPHVKLLACTPCRRRKVKCDHKTPVCSNCLKYGQECVWPESRRYPSRRQQRRSYQDIVARLAKMERLVQELQLDPITDSPNLATKGSDTSTMNNVDDSDDCQRCRTTAQGTSESVTPARTPFFSGAPSEARTASTGACSIFSLRGIRKINGLVGDDSFARIISSLETPSLGTRRILDSSNTPHPLPPNDVIMDCVNDFFMTQNHDIRLFQEDEVRAAIQTYFYDQPPSDSGWYMAVNIILAHTLRKRSRMGNSFEYEKYLQNAMRKVQDVILQRPTTLHVGALLSMVLYFVFTWDNHIAITLLSLAVQPILLSGYHRSNHHPGLTAAESLHRRRLFWQAYIVDHDLMLRTGKPPLIGDEFLLQLPDDHPPDGYGMYYYPNNVSLNFFRQQVRLAQIQGRISSSLYFGNITPSESQIDQLDRELQEWRDSIPEMIRPEPTEALVDADYSRLMCLTTLHFTYFQLIVAIHSAAFRLRAADEGNEAESGAIMPSVALCNDHPFTIYLLYQVAWSVDILFISILQNKTTQRAFQDLQLINNIVSFFERYDPNHQSVFSYYIIKALATIASRALQNGVELPLDCLNPCSTGMAQTVVAASTAVTSNDTNSLAVPIPSPLRGESLASAEQEQMNLEDLSFTNDGGWFTGLLDWNIPLDYQPEVWQDFLSFDARDKQ
ncbi:Fungal specific transcription factor [Fusarium falciforme]|uniref:Fungal specific transcription factor n=1 Tax=Fusarium falciforme TaxID=195108 RepID=UPI002300998A|nr:Fungal specific transcription factor [Fusarium falciforme]WAO97291.1 Fungal specific transcription factor [Fusarium falciforme]